MAKNINRAISLTSYFISLPPARYMLFSIVLLGTVFGIVLDLGKGNVQQSMIDGFVILSLPALVSSVVVKLMISSMPFRRIIGTALCGEAIYSLAYSLSLLLSGVNTLWAQLAILVGSAIVFVVWYVAARFIFIMKNRAVIFAMIQLFFYLFFLVGNQAFYEPTGEFFQIAIKFYVSSFVFLGALILFFYIINAPMKKNIGLSSTDAIAYLFGQWLYHNKDMEKAFEQVGEDAKTILSIMAFKRKSDTIFFVTPCVHFGPFGNLGGSEFSHLLASEIDAKYRSKTFVFHGTVTHDLNPVSSSQLSRLVSAFDNSMKNAVFKEAKVSISTGKYDECHAQALRINQSALIALSRCPQTTEDINFGIGLGLIKEAEKTFQHAMLIDQHNAETGEITSFEPGSPVAFGYLEALKSAITENASSKPLMIGISCVSGTSEVIGKAGIKVAIIGSSPQYAMVVIDSNGVTPVFKEKIESVVKEELGEKVCAGIYTTDTHQTNVVRGVLNPLGEEKETLEAIRKCLNLAKKDMSGAKFFSDTRWFDIKVIGAKQSIEVISTVNSIVAMAKFTLPLILVGALLLLVAVLSKL